MAIDLCGLYRAEKNLVLPARWIDSDPSRFKLNAALMVDGEVIEGLELRGQCPQALPDRGVTLQIQHHPASSPCVSLGRAEWRPLGPHTNPKAGPPNLAFSRIEGSHVHCFHLNWLKAEGRMRAKNLPIARPIEEPNDFEDFLGSVGKEFNITGIEGIGPPPWRLGDLFGI